MNRHGWLLLFHDCIVEQLQKLHTAAERAERSNPEGFESNANVKLFRALSRLIMDTVPGDPARDEYRQGNTMGRAYRHWRRAKIGRRFRLFFRYDSNAKTIVFAWVNDQQSLRAAAGLCTIRPQDTTPGPIIPAGAPSATKSLPSSSSTSWLRFVRIDAGTKAAASATAIQSHGFAHNCCYCREGRSFRM